MSRQAGVAFCVTLIIVFLDNGPCLGVRKPNQPYEWISYKEVSSLSHLVLDLLLLAETIGSKSSCNIKP